MKKLILASSSISRKLLLERLKMPFECYSPDVDETPLLAEKPAELVLRLAQQKAETIAKMHPAALIIGADQVGWLNNEMLTKPLTHDNAVHQLTMVSNQRVEFFTGICLLNSNTNQRQTTVETFAVTFRTLNRSMIENYLLKANVLNCAGSFDVEGLGISLVKQLIGDDYTALIGLPLIKLVEMLANEGVTVI